MNPDDVIRDWFESLWNQGREDTIARLLAPNAEVQFYKLFRGTFPDIRVKVLRTVTQGNMVAAHCHVTGRHTGNALAPASGRAVEFDGMVIVRIEDGKIVEGWNSFDFLALYQQIGLLAPLPA